MRRSRRTGVLGVWGGDERMMVEDVLGDVVVDFGGFERVKGWLGEKRRGISPRIVLVFGEGLRRYTGRV